MLTTGRLPLFEAAVEERIQEEPEDLQRLREDRIRVAERLAEQATVARTQVAPEVEADLTPVEYPPVRTQTDVFTSLPN